MRKANTHTLYWIGITLVLFPILVVLGIYMRTVQFGQLPATQSWFYPMMTLHGLGMVGVCYAASMACAVDALRRYIEPSGAISWLALAGTVAGVVLLLVSVFLGKFAAGWYFLYPLPMRGNWPAWSTVMFLSAITVLGATWLIWSVDMLRAIARRYSLSEALGWHYLAGRTEPEVPPLVLITTVSLIACVACLVAGVIALALSFADVLGGVRSDALLMKNLTFFFGHVLVNLSMYLGLAVTYEVLPEYAGRPWKANKIVALSWNTVLVVFLAAYFHHLYMDFVQPVVVQYIGQVASYISSIPAAVVTLFGALMLVYRSKMRWNLASILLFVGLAGWAIGGVGAVIDSTILVNMKFHNTLWVPAHFHTYMLMGLMLLVTGYFYHCCQAATELPEKPSFHNLVILLLMVGGYGMLFMFYLSGAASIPRRFAVYPAELAHGAGYAGLGAVFAALFLVGLIVFFVEIGKRWIRAFKVAV